MVNNDAYKISGKMIRIFFLISILGAGLSTIYGTAPELNGVNDLTGIVNTNTDPAGNKVFDLINGKIKVHSTSDTIDDFEDSKPVQTIWGTDWYGYPDSIGNSVIPETVSIASNGVNNSKAGSFPFVLGDTLKIGSYFEPPFVELGFSTRVLDTDFRNLSMVDSIKYWYKGPAHTFNVLTTNVTDYNYYYYSVTVSTETWTLVSLKFDSTVFKQASWGKKVPFRRDSVLAFDWIISGAAHTVDTLFLDNIYVRPSFPKPGIVVFGADNKGVNGKWQFKKEGSTTWEDLGAPTVTAARLLSPDSWMRFLPPSSGPNGGYPTVTIYAWDQSDYKANGSTSDVTLHGGETPYSQLSATSKIEIGEKARIVVQPRDTSVSVNTTAPFTVSAVGTPAPGYLWLLSTNGGSKWDSIAGANANTYSFTAVTADNNKKFRCVARNSYGQDTSAMATLTVVSVQIPVFITNLRDTVVIEQSTLQFPKLNITGAQPFTYKWFKDAQPPQQVGSNELFSIPAITKAHEGKYYLEVSNGAGSAISYKADVKVYKIITITGNLNPTMSFMENSDASLTIGADGNGTVKYQWYKNNRVSTDPGAPDKTLLLGKVTKATHNDTTYYCTVWSSWKGTDTIGPVVKSTVCTLKVSILANPFTLLAEKIDQATKKVKLTITSSQNMSNFPVEINLSEYCDTMYVLYKTNGYPTDKNDATEIIKFSTKSIKEAPNNTISSEINLKSVGSDSAYFFSASAFWHYNGGTKDTLLKPFYNGNSISFGSGYIPENKLSVSGVYMDLTDFAEMTVTNINSMVDNKDSSVVIELSENAGFSVLLSSGSYLVRDVKKNGDPFKAGLWVGKFPFEKKKVYYRWRIVSYSATISPVLSGMFDAGYDRPVYAGELKLDTTSSVNKIAASWTKPGVTVDSIRIWWNTQPIPKEAETDKIGLPIAKAFYVKNKDLDHDTVVKAFSPNTVYYFGLQIFQNHLWSRITDLSSKSIKTKNFNQNLNVNNAIQISSASFDSVKNAIVLNWSVDSSVTPAGARLEWGASYSVYPDESFKLTLPDFYPVKKASNNADSITLNSDIVFDATFYIGMWLRAVNDTSSGMPSAPTAAATKTVKIPSFTWQIISLSASQIDTAYAANAKIIVQSLSPFDYKDTLFSYRPPNIPAGFVSISGTGFRFGTVNPEIGAMMLGLKYSLPGGISDARVKLYRYVASRNKFEVVYSSYTMGGAVWDTLTRDKIVYPYLVLADVSEPKVEIKKYEAVVNDDVDKVYTTFRATDNAGNLRWIFMYGNGQEGFPRSARGTLDLSVDTITGIADNKYGVVHRSFGLRAQLVVTDGVSSCTTDVSRSVRDPSGQSLPYVAKRKWQPLISALTLDKPDIDAVLNNSVGITTPWQYKKELYRIFRYYNPSSSDTNTWTEYSASVKDDFKFVPGRVIWYKSVEGDQIRFGSGITTSLRDRFEITLKPRTWTDIALPFQFDILLYDILNANAAAPAESLEIYHWRWSDNVATYEPIRTFIGPIQSVSDIKDTVMGAGEAYIVYNHNPVPVTFYIPSRCAPVPGYAAYAAAGMETVKSDKWYIQFGWRDKTGDRKYHTIPLGYNTFLGKQAYYGPFPPTLRDVYAGVVDDSRNVLCGYGIQKEMKNGGMTFTIEFVNNSPGAAAVEYRIENGMSLPEGFRARILNPQTMIYEDEEKSLEAEVPKESTAERVVVIGKGDYFDNVLAVLAQYNFQFVKVFPNPFRNAVHVCYTLPKGIAQVAFALYDIRGRVVWERRETKQVTPGPHSVTYNGSAQNALQGILSSGIYIMRMTVSDKADNAVFRGEKKITCLK